MATTLDDVFDVFYKKMVGNPQFFSYRNVSDVEALELMEENATAYMQESIALIYDHSNNLQVDFYDYDLNTEEFGFDMTRKEIDLVTDIMVQMHLSRDLVKLRVYEHYFTTNEINTFSGANERRTFVDMYNDIESKNIRKIKSYSSRDRLTNNLKAYSEVSV